MTRPSKSSIVLERMGSPERERTPELFARWLVELAITCELKQ